jgi:beta-galactosidase
VFEDNSITIVADSTATSLRLVNRYTFLDLSHLSWRWELLCSISQYPIGTGFARVDHGRLIFGWNEASACHLREVESKHAGSRYFLNIMGGLRENTSWADAGHVVVRKQFRVDSVRIEGGVNTLKNVIPIQVDNHVQMMIRETHDTLAVTASREKGDDDRATPFVIFSKVTGSILSLCWDGQIDLLGRNGLTTNFTRAATDNDRGGLELVLHHMMLSWAQPAFFWLWGYQHFSHNMHWRKHGLTQDQPPRVVCNDMTYKQQDHVGVITADCSVKNTLGRILFKQFTTYTVCGHSRQIQVRYKIVPQPCLHRIPSLPRIGVSLEVHQALCKVSYYGRGPKENYPDRKSGSFMGVYTTIPSQMGYDYIVPSENGNRSDCQWVCLNDDDSNGGDNTGLLIVASGDNGNNNKKNNSFGVSALLHNANELNHASHSYDLDQERSDGTHPIFVNIDHQLMGLGGDVR